jgi:hypothetical protein
MTLISAYEVRKYSPAGNNYDTSLLQPFIKGREEYVANNCLTWAFYNTLIGDKVSYAGVDYSSGSGYAKDDVVNDPSTGLLYIALQTVPSGTALSNVSYWALANKFSTATYNLLWEGGLRDYLAFSVYRSSLAAGAFKSTSQGVMRHVGSNEETANYKEVSYVHDALKEAEKELYANLVDYLKRNSVAGWSKACEDENCSEMRTKNLGFIF